MRWHRRCPCSCVLWWWWWLRRRLHGMLLRRHLLFSYHRRARRLVARPSPLSCILFCHRCLRHRWTSWRDALSVTRFCTTFCSASTAALTVAPPSGLVGSNLRCPDALPSETCSCRSRPSLDADHLLTCEYWNRKSCTPFARTSRSVSPTSRIHSTPGWFGFNRTSGNETFWNGAGGGGDCCEEAEAGKKPPAPAPPNPDNDDDDITLTKQRRCALKSELSLKLKKHEAHLRKAWSLKLSEGVLKDNKS